MADTYSQILLHIVFAVKGRQSLISPVWEDDLYKYITGIIHNNGQNLLAINGMPDHIHMLVGFRPGIGISDMVREIKKASNKYIAQNKLTRWKFEWQKGYGVFSYHQSMKQTIVRYILNQKTHHAKVSFGEEYKQLLNEFEIVYKEEYLFDGPELD